MHFSTTKINGIFYAIVSGMFYGLMGYFGIVIIKNGLSIYNMMFWRFTVSTILILLILPFTKQKKLPLIQILKIMFYAGCLYCLSSISYFIASKNIGTGLAMVIFFTYPVIVMLINLLFFNKQVGVTYYIASFIILLGMIFLSDITSCKLNLYGMGFAIISALFYAIYIFVSKDVSIEPIISTLAVSIGCMLTSFIIAIIDGSFFVPSGFMIWRNIFCIGIICTAIPILMLLESMKYISSEQASIFSVSEPLFTVIFGIFLLGEMINTKQLFGVVFLLSGALITLLPKNK